LFNLSIDLALAQVFYSSLEYRQFETSISQFQDAKIIQVTRD